MNTGLLRSVVLGARIKSAPFIKPCCSKLVNSIGWYSSTMKGFHLQCHKVIYSIDVTKRCYSKILSDVEYDWIAEETLESLCESLETLPDLVNCSSEFDVSYSQGVLTLKLGKELGTYVINKQSPNLQIWLSSPLSGPKRYDYIDGKWIYKHDQVQMEKLLQDELRQLFSTQIINIKFAP